MEPHDNPLDIRLRPVVWLNVICLDAPLVAISWQWIFSHSFHIAVSTSVRAALFLTAWLIYLIDRFADSRSLKTNEPLRQRFCSRHPMLWIGLIAITATLDATVVLFCLDRQLIFSGALLGGAALFYLALNYAASRLWEVVPLKEVAVGFLFAAGALLAFIPYLSTSITSIMLAASFAVLCSLNCMSIAVWERDLDLSQGKHSIATRWPAANIWVRGACVALGLSAWLMLDFIDHSFTPLLACVAAGSIMLAALHAIPIQRDQRTALADLVLLTPVFLFCFEIFK